MLCLLCVLPLFGSAGELTQSTPAPMKIIAYGTAEFTEFVKKAPVSLDKAWDIQLDFYKSNPKEMEYSLYTQSAALYFIFDKYYVYTLVPLVKTKPPMIISKISNESRPNDCWANMKVQWFPQSHVLIHDQYAKNK